MFRKNRKSPFEEEWENLCKHEQRMKEKHQLQRETRLNQILKEKVPHKLQQTLDVAFEKSFSLVFEKGTSVIEKTYNKSKIESEHKIDRYADSIYHNKKSLKSISKKATKGEAVNVALSGASGIGMGFLGIGIPDIPVFTGVMLKSIYEIALRYGFSYETAEERFFILMLIEGAVSYGEKFEEIDGDIDTFIENKELPSNISTSEQISNTSRGLSKELLYMKFLQGIPVVGSIGGAYDIAYIKTISEYAQVKYKKRFLLNYKKS